MKIKYDGGRRVVTFREIFYIGIYPWDESDYGLSVVLFGYEWNWLIWKKDKSA
jgi:hypothetical protein